MEQAFMPAFERMQKNAQAADKYLSEIHVVWLIADL
jgi:hypothetical protein